MKSIPAILVLCFAVAAQAADVKRLEDAGYPK
jgi:hypothetical protein